MLHRKVLVALASVTIAMNAFAGMPKRLSSDLERDKASKGPEIVELAEISTGMKVLDLLGGAGYYSEIIAAKVGKSGKVLLHNNKAYMPYVEKGLNERFANNRLSTVKRFDRELEELALKPKSLDAIFFVLGYHDIYHTADGWKVDRSHLLDQIATGLKSGGKLVVIDHAAKAGSGIESSQDLHRIDKEYVVDELSQLGFKVVHDSNVLHNPKDDHTISPFKPEMRRKTDRFVLVFIKE